jgi:hypothetical protein
VLDSCFDVLEAWRAFLEVCRVERPWSSGLKWLLTTEGFHPLLLTPPRRAGFSNKRGDRKFQIFWGLLRCRWGAWASVPWHVRDRHINSHSLGFVNYVLWLSCYWSIFFQFLHQFDVMTSFGGGARLCTLACKGQVLDSPTTEFSFSWFFRFWHQFDVMTSFGGSVPLHVRGRHLLSESSFLVLPILASVCALACKVQVLCFVNYVLWFYGLLPSSTGDRTCFCVKFQESAVLVMLIGRIIN